jgi:Cys-tRNA(Pro) deacylase
MSIQKLPVTRAIRTLKAASVSFTLHPYPYEDKGGTATASAALGIDEHRIVKTLVMEDDAGKPFIILMHGDKQVSTKNLARQLGVKTVQPCSQNKAEKLTGYVVGGISPFGIRQKLPVYIETTILSLPEICINAGKRGLLLTIATQDLVRILDPKPVTVAV